MNEYQIIFTAPPPPSASIISGMCEESWDVFWYMFTRLYFVFSGAFAVALFIVWLGEL